MSSTAKVRQPPAFGKPDVLPPPYWKALAVKNKVDDLAHRNDAARMSMQDA